MAVTRSKYFNSGHKVIKFANSFIVCARVVKAGRLMNCRLYIGRETVDAPSAAREF
jgi:hypothetical protein